MLLNILDSQSAQQQILTNGQEAVVDRSALIGSTALSQTLLEPNLQRSGWIFQNRGTNVMYINDFGQDASASLGSFMVLPGGIFPPAGFPVTTSKISILGTGGDGFTAREW